MLEDKAPAKKTWKYKALYVVRTFILAALSITVLATIDHQQKLAAAAAKAAAEKAAYEHEGQPYLLGKCFVVNGQIMVSFLEKVTMPNGDMVYGTLWRIGPMAKPQLMAVRGTNEDTKQMLSEGKLVEVNCASGEPVGK